MPDPSLIHGRAIPAPELAAGTVTVRVVREAIGNNIANEVVRVRAGGVTRTASTDELGRAEFPNLPPGAEAVADATVGTEALVSQPFSIPRTGGLRVILVAGMAAAAERRKKEAEESASAPAARGTVVFGGDSRVMLQFSDDSLQVYYVLEIVNTARTKVDVGGPLTIVLPTAASGPTALEGSSPLAAVSRDRITITGPFPVGTTGVQVAYRLPYSTSEITIEQAWPVPIQRVAVAVEKVGSLAMSSAQVAETREIRTEDGDVFLLATGPALEAGRPLAVRLSNLPLHSRTPRNVALALALAVAGLGIWLGTRERGREVRAALTRRREELLAQLTNLDLRRRGDAPDLERHASRRQRIVRDLERVYADLDQEGGPNAGTSPG
jgi:hypothetical protein